MTRVASLQPSTVNFAEVKEPAQLLEMSPEASPYAFGQMFSIAKGSDRRLGRLKIRQLRKLDRVIRSVLHPGERVFYLFDGIKNNLIEQYFIGFLVYFYNHNAFIFTPERIILVHLEGKKALGRFVGQINYEDVKEVKASGLSGSVTLKFYNGKQISFARVSRQDRAFIKEVVQPLVAANAGPPARRRSIINLCPQCYTEIDDPHTKACPGCGCAFKTPRMAAMFSLIFPGLGDLYLGSWVGLLEVFAMIFVWIGAIFSLIAMTSGVVPAEASPYQDYPPVTWGDVGFLFFVILTAHVADALKTLHVAKKGIFPKEGIQKIRSRMVEVGASVPAGFRG